MASPYSVRFAIAVGGRSDYVVPAGKRAVLKCVTAYNSAASVGGFGVFIGPTPVLSRAIPAGTGTEMVGLHLVANEGETLGLNAVAPATAQMSGYLLDAT